jgi:hypothetical protein
MSREPIERTITSRGTLMLFEYLEEQLQRWCSVCDLAKIFFTSKFSYLLFFSNSAFTLLFRTGVAHIVPGPSSQKSERRSLSFRSSGGSRLGRCKGVAVGKLCKILLWSIDMRYVSENLGSIVLKLQEIWGSIFANTDSVHKWRTVIVDR